MPNIAVNNANFYYELHGKGPSFILIAGYGSNGRSWMPIVGELSRHFQAIQNTQDLINDIAENV